ncbi:hypothetical protein [Salinimicrobium sp. HB62]|uniref:hypothetical protein n=1 Tax=Salinimicrobium sp. HB62 TaxID=3077781 RepID=UPI002D785C7D|nr:hypothetical protein [Salinimicrobium sp. HB62]
MTNESNFIDENINIYIDFNYLTAKQLSIIINSANEIYNDLIQIGVFDDFVSFSPENHYFSRFLHIPLCIQQINTGNSVNTKFSLENRLFPGYRIENGDTLKILLPKWSAAVIMTGYILTYGVEKYEQFLEIKIKELELEEKQDERNERKKRELQNQSLKLSEYRNQRNNSTYINIQTNYYQFQSQIQQKNINKVEVNGISVKQDTGE